MRILIATFHRNVIGGTEKYLQGLLPRLAASGHEVALLHERPLEAGRERIDSALDAKAWCVAEEGLAGILRLIGEWKPDVVYSHGLESGELERKLLERYSVVLFGHGYYGTCASGHKCHSFPQIRPCGRRFGPACLLLYYARQCGTRHPGEALQVLGRQLERRRTLSEYRAVVVGSTHMYREFERHGVPSERLFLAPLPCPDGSDVTEAPGPRTPNGNIILMGRLTASKGGRYLIEAIQRASKRLGRSLRLTVAGDGPDRAELERHAAKLRVKADFAGWIDSGRKTECLLAADLIAVPSLWPEPFGLVGIEAARLGVPAVGYAVGGIPDWLIAGQTGELAPGDPPTVEGLADAIVRALGDPQHYAELRRGAWEFSRRFTMEAHLAKLELALGTEQTCPLEVAR